VTCVDIDKAKVEKLSGGQITIYEPGLEKIFLRNIKEERLRFTTGLEEAVEDAEIIFLALPTPPGADGSVDLKYVLGVAEHLGKILKGYKKSLSIRARCRWVLQIKCMLRLQKILTASMM
jgi:UDPglucose 6-dehydrogenase